MMRSHADETLPRSVFLFFATSIVPNPKDLQKNRAVKRTPTRDLFSVSQGDGVNGDGRSL